MYLQIAVCNGRLLGVHVGHGTDDVKKDLHNTCLGQILSINIFIHSVKREQEKEKPSPVKPSHTAAFCHLCAVFGCETVSGHPSSIPSTPECPHRASLPVENKGYS
jgi:hypothetical protein